jgi:hypothetical protein
MSRSLRRAFPFSSAAILTLASGACAVAPSEGTAGETAAELITTTQASWCAHVTGGAPATKSPLLSLSATHAAVRTFGTHATTQEADRALAKAVTRPFAADERVLRDYVDALGDGQECVVRASRAELPRASVRLVGDVAVVRPGTGALTLPAGAKAVAIDLRDLPSVPFDIANLVNGSPTSDPLRLALDSAAALALAMPIPRATFNTRYWAGMTNGDPQYGDVGNSNDITQWQFEPIPAGATVDLPLALLTGTTMAPAAAELAATLRLAKRAWIFGADVPAAVAESNWSAVGDHGIAYRELDMLVDASTNERWPDVIAADARGADPVALAHALASLGAPPAQTKGPDARPRLTAIGNPYDLQPPTIGAGEARAGLLIVHGALRMFDPNFGDLGDRIDSRLGEMLVAVEAAALAAGPLNREFYFDVLRRFGEALHDGHNFITDEARPFSGFLPMKLEEIDGNPVVRRSEIEGIAPGDTIATIDGVPQALWYAEQLALTSASTDRYRWNLATRKRLLRVYGPRRLGVVSVDGHFREVIATPKPYAYEATFGSAPVERASGWLGAEGAVDVFYLNMANEQTPDPQAALAAIANAQGARAMIVDMRGFPHGNHYLVDQALIPTTFSTPWFISPYVFSPNATDTLSFPGASPVDPGGPPSYAGPIVLLIGTDTVSAGENFAMMLVDAKRPVHVVGRPSAGTNGTLTGLQVLGQFAFDFTGLGVRHADNTKFLGVGIVPDIAVALSPKDFAAGRDPELTAALTALAP